jgi:hypothetical protein
MTKRLISLMLVVAGLAAFGCGDDDSDKVAPAPAGKELRKLTPVELRGLCEELLNKVRSASTPEQQCVQTALDMSTTTSACDTARKSCLSDKDYQDFDKARCKDFSKVKEDDPPFDCDSLVSEVTSCYDRVATWLTGLRCSQAGKSPEIPSCIEDLSDGKCGVGLSQLLTTSEPGDGGASDSGSMSCEPFSSVSCLCSDGAKGMQSCNKDGVYEPCECKSASGFQCKAGSKSYPYDFDGTSACNECATENCCQSYIDCRNDKDCACYWDCLGSNQDDCETPCDISGPPDKFVDHAVCLHDNCLSPCKLQD